MESATRKGKSSRVLVGPGRPHRRNDHRPLDKNNVPRRVGSIALSILTLNNIAAWSNPEPGIGRTVGSGAQNEVISRTYLGAVEDLCPPTVSRPREKRAPNVETRSASVQGGLDIRVPYVVVQSVCLNSGRLWTCSVTKMPMPQTRVRLKKTECGQRNQCLATVKEKANHKPPTTKSVSSTYTQNNCSPQRRENRTTVGRKIQRNTSHLAWK